MVAELRAFLAVELPRDVKNELLRWRRSLEPALAGFRWGRVETLHLTLRFLGNVSPERFAAVGALLERGLEAGGPLTLTPRGLGVFPDARRPRVLWAGLEGETARLARVTTNLNASLERLGVPPDTKPFRAHLTLARAAGAVRPGAVARALEAASDWTGPSFRVGEVLLFESILEPGGARHLARHRGLLL